MFSSSFHGRHCLVLAGGYFTWRTVGKRKQPYRIALKTGEPFAMAGIYAREPTEFDTAEKNQNFAILTNQSKRSSQRHPRSHAGHSAARREVVAPTRSERDGLALAHCRHELPRHTQDEPRLTQLTPLPSPRSRTSTSRGQALSRTCDVTFTQQLWRIQTLPSTNLDRLFLPFRANLLAAACRVALLRRRSHRGFSPGELPRCAGTDPFTLP